MSTNEFGPGLLDLHPLDTELLPEVGSDSGSWSIIYSFVSQNGDLGETFAFLFGDMGTATPYLTFLRTQDESTSTIKWISRDIEALGNKPAIISHIGGISYARAYSWLWDNFFSQVEAVASRVSYHICIGNHEYDWPLQHCLDVDKFLNRKIEMFEEMSLVYGNDRARGDCAKSFVD